jgi:GH15 family glucan-1,4-alpha-glucosidase
MPSIAEQTELSKIDFFRLLNDLKNSKSLGFNYIGNMNDPMTSRYWVKRTASYEFYLIADGKEHVLVSRTHQRSHDEVREQLIKRYTKWYNDWKKGITVTDLVLKKYSKK